VSEPAPRDMICFVIVGDCERKSWIRLSMAVVRMYVPLIQVIYSCSLDHPWNFCLRNE
jgi:tetrahydromethanopterin S-methyltransferase subunit C